MTPRLLIRAGLLGLFVGSMGLAACGKQGVLDRPGPLFCGARSERAAERRAERDAAARANGEKDADTSATSQTNGDYTQASDGAKDPALVPMRTNPPPGASSGGPLGNRGGGGVLPDPFADPNRAPR